MSRAVGVALPLKAPSSPGPLEHQLAVVTGPDLAARLRHLSSTLRVQLQRASVLSEMVRDANASVEPGGVADTIVARAAEWIPAPCWSVAGLDLASHVTLLAERGLPEPLRLPAQTIGSWVMRHGQELAIADLTVDRRTVESATGAVIAWPLVARGRTVGALVAMDPLPATRTPRLSRAFGRALGAVLEPAAIALDNALRLQRAEALSVTDDLTQLYNSRYLTQVLRREAKRASRSGRPLSLLFVDLDGFKGINDVHGHLSGSRALVEAGGVIRGCARETDVVARFGGDEFSIVLPDTGSDGARAVGERIRERVAAHAFLAVDGHDIHLTASVGVATLPDVAASAESLLHAADKAMYCVKDRGKDGICVAGEDD